MSRMSEVHMDIREMLENSTLEWNFIRNYLQRAYSLDLETAQHWMKAVASEIREDELRDAWLEQRYSKLDEPVV